MVKGSGEVDVAEGMAMRHALNISLEAGFRNLCLETDCLKLHNSLVKGIVNPIVLGAIVRDILALSRQCSSYSFSFVKRDGNKVAHSLAKLSSSYEGLRVWLEDIPNVLYELVEADLMPPTA